MNYEVVQEHKYQDIYRICYGVLLIVNKFKKINHSLYFVDQKENKKSFKKVEGLKNCYTAKEDIQIPYSKNIVTKGSVIFEHGVIEPISDKSDFFYELKTTGSCFSGNYEEFKKLNEIVDDIITNKY
jgi:hypothetical protein